MAKPLVPDDLWAAIEPLLPVERPKPKGGWPRLPDRAALTGIMFVLVTGSPWERLPVEMGCGSGMSCWRRLRDWQAAGVWRQLHRVLLERLQASDAIALRTFRAGQLSVVPACTDRALPCASGTPSSSVSIFGITPCALRAGCSILVRRLAHGLDVVPIRVEH